MAQGESFTGKLYLGDSTAAPSVSSGSGAPGGTGNAGDVYTDKTTGDLYTSDGTAWTSAIRGTSVANEVLIGSGTGTIQSDPNLTFDGTNLTVATGGSTIDVGQGYVTGGPNLTVETMAGGTLNLGNGDVVDLVAALEIRVNGTSGTAGEVLTSNGIGVPATWQVVPVTAITQLTGDVTAGPGSGSQSATVERIQGNPVSSVAPADGQVLTWNGGAWVPGAAASGGSGGGGQTYFLNAGTAGGAPIVGLPGATKQFGLTAEVGGTTITSAALPTGGVWAVVAGFVTDPGSPGITAIPAGVWDFNVWAQSSTVTPNSVLFRLNVYKYDGVTATLLSTGTGTPVYDPTSLIQYISSTLLPQTPILVTDRIYVELEATATIAGQTISVDFGSTTPSHAHTTLPSVAGTGIVHVINGVFQSPASPIDLTGGPTEISGILPIANGGTNTNTVPANGELLIGNGAGYTVAALTASSNIDITNGAGSISIKATPAGANTEIQLNSGGTTFGSSSDLVFDGNSLSVLTGGSSIDVGLGFITGGPSLTVEAMAGGTLTLGNANIVNLTAATDIQVNGSSGAAGEVLTSNGAGVPATWQSVVTGIDQLTGDVVAGPGSGSQAATVQGMGGSTSKVHFVIVGGQYATLQDAVNAAAANDVILVGPIGPVTPASSWGDVTFPAQKRLTVIGMDGARGVQANIGKVTFSPSAGGSILENIVQLENLFINTSFAGSQGVVFGGSDPARLRIVNCYVFNTAITGDGIVVNNSGAGSSCYIDGTTIQGAGTGGVGIKHTQGYTLIKGGTEVSAYQYQLTCAAGLVEVTQTKFVGSLANEVVRITGGTVFLLNSSTIQNLTANSSGVNITAAGAAFGMTNSTFAIATGTGYCLRGVAGGVFLYGQINYSNSAALAYNVKLQNTLTAFAVTQAFTLAP